MDENRLTTAAKLGADEVIHPPEEDPITIVRQLTGGEGADCVVVAVASTHAIEQGLRIARRCGTINIFGDVPPGSEIRVDPNVIHYNELRLTGTYASSLKEFKETFEMISNEKVDIKPLITGKYPLDQALKAFEAAEKMNNLRVLMATRTKAKRQLVPNIGPGVDF